MNFPIDPDHDCFCFRAILSHFQPKIEELHMSSLTEQEVNIELMEALDVFLTFFRYWRSWGVITIRWLWSYKRIWTAASDITNSRRSRRFLSKWWVEFFLVFSLTLIFSGESCRWRNACRSAKIDFGSSDGSERIVNDTVMRWSGPYLCLWIAVIV